MTKKTSELIESLCSVIDDNGYLLLSGGLGVGKTFLAMQVAEESRKPIYNKKIALKKSNTDYTVNTEIISVHPGLYYEDFVRGIIVDSENGYLKFDDADKIFLRTVSAAHNSIKNNEGKKYFIIIDDINRGFISGILGDVLSTIELHGSTKCSIEIEGGEKITLPENLFLILTENTLLDSKETIGSGFRRRFLNYFINSDYSYMDESYESRPYSYYDTTASAVYYKVNKIIDDHLAFQYKSSESEKERFFLGHGIFNDKDIAGCLRYQIIPILYQYVKDGILDKNSKVEISALEDLVYSDFTKNIEEDETTIIKYANDPGKVDTAYYLANTLSHQPIYNLVKRIKEQNLISDSDIVNGILLNENVLTRTNATFDKVAITFSQTGYLFVKKTDAHIFHYGTKKNKRDLYSNTDMLQIKDVDYVIAKEMQNTETWTYSDSWLEDSYKHNKNSGPSAIVLFLIIKNFYSMLTLKYQEYLKVYPGDLNIQALSDYAEHEWLNFLDKFKAIKSVAVGADKRTLQALYPTESDDEIKHRQAKLKNEANEKANKDVLDLIVALKLVWLDKGQNITWKSQQVQVEGVYKMDTVVKYREYYRTMDKLKINQMIMQGPPGTSKTFSTRGLLRYIAAGIGNDDMISDAELDKMQITNYEDISNISVWQSENGKNPALAWDIVQFHPSYGYEDFVRGIEVSTEKDEATGLSHITYDTVNKILGKMADLANRAEFNPDTKFFLVVDEINRANLATVFGELIFGLEYRGKGVSTPYTIKDGEKKDNKVILPDNLYIIGTMNTADKSIGGIDYAIRRRFLFFTLLPSKETIEKFRVSELSGTEKEEQEKINSSALKLFDRVSKLFDSDNLNNEYYREDVQIGHTYFLVDSETQLEMRFKYQILPILREYYKDGMFQFDLSSEEITGWNGLLQYISGQNMSDKELKELFDSLIKE